MFLVLLRGQQSKQTLPWVIHEPYKLLLRPLSWMSSMISGCGNTRCLFAAIPAAPGCLHFHFNSEDVARGTEMITVSKSVSFPGMKMSNVLTRRIIIGSSTENCKFQSMPFWN